MKLNHDCVRELLLYIEEKSDYKTIIYPGEISIGYSSEDVLYAADKLLEANYLDGLKKNFMGSEMPQIAIRSLTWDGHLFLDNIRDKTIWDKTKAITERFASISISLLDKIASQLILEMIKSQL